MYKEYKKLRDIALKSNNISAIGYFLCYDNEWERESYEDRINKKVRSYKYSHSDLTKDEHIKLMRMNGLNDDDMLCGGEVLRVVGDVESRELVLTTVDEIDLFTILEQINFIINKRKTN